MFLMENLKYKKGKGGKLLTNTNKLSYSVIARKSRGFCI